MRIKIMSLQGYVQISNKFTPQSIFNFYFFLLDKLMNKLPENVQNQ